MRVEGFSLHKKYKLQPIHVFLIEPLKSKAFKKTSVRGLTKRTGILVRNITKNARMTMTYFIHGCAFSLLFLVFFGVWTFEFPPSSGNRIEINIGASIARASVDVLVLVELLIGFVLFFVCLGFLNAFVTRRLWFRTTYRLWDVLFHGLTLFSILYVVNSIVIAWPYLSSPSIETAAITLIVAAFVDGFLAKMVAGQWKQEQIGRAHV